LCRPREDEHGLDVEHHEQQREDVVAHLALRPALADGVDTAFISKQFLVPRSRRAHHRRHPQQQAGEQDGDEPEPPDREVRTEEVRHPGRVHRHRHSLRHRHPQKLLRGYVGKKPVDNGHYRTHCSDPVVCHRLSALSQGCVWPAHAKMGLARKSASYASTTKIPLSEPRKSHF